MDSISVLMVIGFDGLTANGRESGVEGGGLKSAFRLFRFS